MKIAIMGFGTVGTGVEEILYKKRESLLKNNFDIKIEKVLIRNKNKKRSPLDGDLAFTDDFDEILNSDVDTVIDVTSSLEETYERIVKLMEAGKNIVTANKAVVSKYFEELNKLARENDISFSYEAAVAGAIPVIHPLMEEAFFSDMNKVQGILNGTSNYILSKMEVEGSSYDEVLKEAQELGYAEADPTADVGGFDAMRKIRIFSSLIYNSKINEDEIFTFGIENVKKSDFDFAKERGYSIRVLAKSELANDKINISVIPTFVRDNFFAKTFGGTNGVKVWGENFTSYELKGPGAGKLETADAVMRDLLRILAKREIKTFYDAGNSYKVENNLENKFYVRTSEVSTELKDLIEEEKIIDDEHLIITRKVSLDDLRHALGNLDKVFLAEIEEDL
ncbi:Homoserine dehydrogenase [Peptoniphilus harei]|uniref:homoserine dehydrogenase n=1 Tax=Peptoniphilus harei TaxID=54005 RepID=UPI000F6F1088|nr:homoserine dehydrogenase [Peptoniphilus harei]QQE46872.1 homoserine dehydrogenase [Peptoniphilus harei]VEJ34956.1 Homoserine dehydrogenase [Peptoniphilus harei]